MGNRYDLSHPLIERINKKHLKAYYSSLKAHSSKLIPPSHQSAYSSQMKTSSFIFTVYCPRNLVRKYYRLANILR